MCLFLIKEKHLRLHIKSEIKRFLTKYEYQSKQLKTCFTFVCLVMLSQNLQILQETTIIYRVIVKSKASKSMSPSNLTSDFLSAYGFLENVCCLSLEVFGKRRYRAVTGRFQLNDLVLAALWILFAEQFFFVAWNTRSP